MTTAIAPPRIVGASITPLNSEQASNWLNWINGGKPPNETYDMRFVLVHSDSGVTWGYLDDFKQWKLGAVVDPALCPVPKASSLHELRLIGPEAEVLIWRVDHNLQGRVLADDGNVFDGRAPLRPMNQGRRLRYNPKDDRPPVAQSGFKRYVDAGGAQHLAPESFPEEFSVRHYFEQAPETGAVRIAATRLVAVTTVENLKG